MFLFIGSEAMLFGSFFTAYFFVRVVNPGAHDRARALADWLPCKEPLVDGVCQAGFWELPIFVAGMNTAILVTSSFTMHWALQSIKRDNRNGLQAGLVLTILMGPAFLLTQMSSTPISGSTRPTAPSPRSSSVSPASTALTSSSG